MVEAGGGKEVTWEERSIKETGLSGQETSHFQRRKGPALRGNIWHDVKPVNQPQGRRISNKNCREAALERKSNHTG